MGCDFLKKDFCKKDFYSDTLRSLPLTLWEAALGEGGSQVLHMESSTCEAYTTNSP